MSTICSETFQNFMKAQKSLDASNIILEGTVPTGLEKIAISEIIEKLYIDVSNTVITQGHVYFTINISDYDKVKDLRSVDNIKLVVQYHPFITFTSSEEYDLERIRKLAFDDMLTEGVEKWAKLTSFTGNITPNREEHDVAKSIREQNKSSLEIKAVNVLKYRVTCTRALTHSFTSTKAQYIYGGALNDIYNWVVGLDDFDINIILKIVGNFILVALKLTQISLHNRCLIELGPTSLRPTIAYSMLRLCNIKTGDIVIDPLCGGGSIPIEAAYGFSESIVMCGDIHELAVQRSQNNINAINNKLKKPDVFHWDSGMLPFHDNSIDVVCTDLPFGKRCSGDIRQLYKIVLKEFSRIVKRESGRVCILVHKAHNVIANLAGSLYVERKITVNVGGLKCTVFLLRHHQTSNF